MSRHDPAARIGNFPGATSLPPLTFFRRVRDFRLVLREIKNVRRERAAGKRRWFESEAMELVVWLDPADRLQGFQICYDNDRKEYALTWREGRGFAHNSVDTGDATPLANLTPILQPDGHAPWDHIVRLFDESSGGLEPDLRQLIRSKLAQGSTR